LAQSKPGYGEIMEKRPSPFTVLLPLISVGIPPSARPAVLCEYDGQTPDPVRLLNACGSGAGAFGLSHSALEPGAP
jgi:hypothetical protein